MYLADCSQKDMSDVVRGMGQPRDLNKLTTTTHSI